MKILSRSILRKLIIAVITLIGVWSCGVTRHIPDGEYLLNKVVVSEAEETPKSEMISPYEMERYVRQAPNKRLFGTNFYIWVYNSANPDKDNWWNRLKRKIGEEPIYYSEMLSEKSIENLKIYMNAQGFYGSTAQFEVDTTSKYKRAKVTYNTHQGRPYLIDSISYTFRDTMLRGLVLQDTTKSLLHRDDIFSVALLDKERERVTSQLRTHGYFNFTVDNIEYQADTLMGDNRVGVNMIIKKNLSGYDERGYAIMTDNKRFRVEEINIFPDFDPTVVVNDTTFLSKIDTLKWRGLNIIHYQDEEPNVKAKVLRQAVSVYPGRIFNYQYVNQTYLNLMSIGYFKSARINFSEIPEPLIASDTLLSRRRYSADESVETSSPMGYLTSYILCTPALKQSFNIELEGSTTSSFYGLTATAGYQNRNIFRGTESLDIDFVVGYEHMKAPDAIKTKATEIGVNVGLSIPRFIIPALGYRFPMTLKPRTKIEASVNFQDRPYYNRTLSSLGISYSWLTKNYSSFTVRPIDINLIDMKYIDADYYDQLENEYLKNSYQTQLVTGLSSAYIYNNQGKNINGHSTALRINLETAGNTVQAYKELTKASKDSDGNYNLFGITYAQYIRADINVSRKLSLFNGNAIAGRLFAGVGVPYGNSNALPFDRLFYSGGSNSMRGWTPRTLGPGNSELPEDMVYPTQLGDMKLEANLEYRFPIWGMIHGATFVDVGNVWYLPNDYNDYDEVSVFGLDTFYKQLGFNTGFGLRLDIQFAVLRLDWGIQIHSPNEPVGDRWISGFDFAKSAINFGVGYPF
ncbi:MAG: BamA/TamA family outer membrane protein [Rikenellaceae bacterium]